MLIQRFRKISPICKLFPQMNLFGSTMNEYFTLWGGRPISSAAISDTSGTNSSLSCACSSASSYPATRRSRVAINEAQDALFDYLHCTRGLYYTDAEHISKNSPNFLQYLMSKVEEEQEIRKSIVRYLRYHPINEFEPFFESIGLKPFEFLPLLPPNLMFLSDDIQMLALFHVLCNYGVPRNKIGKIYKEVGQIFRYDSEPLRLKLVSFENLGLKKSSVIKLIASCPDILIGGVDKDFVRVWEKLKTLGIDHEWVQAYLDEKNTYHWNRMIGMLDFVCNMGCSDVDLSKLLKNYPRFFLDDSGNHFYVVVALLLKSGLSMTEVLSLLVDCPRVLAGKFAKNLWEAVHFLYEVGMEAEEVEKIVKSHTQVLGSYTLVKPIRALCKLKMDAKMIRDMIREDPNELRRLALERKKRRRVLIVNIDSPYLAEKTNFLLRLGFVENSEEMMKARKFLGRGDLLQERFECLVNAGLDFDAAVALIRSAPFVLNLSRDVIEKKIDYLINSLGQPIESIITFPKYFLYNTMRTARRVKIYNWLKEKGVARPKVALSTLVSQSEKSLIKNHVSLHPGGLEEWERLKTIFSC